MHVDDLCDDILLIIFSNFDLRTRRLAAETCRRWSKICRRSWKSLRSISFHTMFRQKTLPKGKYLNKALHWVLRRCGRYLKSLDMTDPEPEFRFVKANERTFQIIGYYCHNLEEVDFTDLLLLNDLLHEFVRVVNCKNIIRMDLNSAFNHFCTIHDGLSALYKACPRIEYINISNSLNARVRECEERWPTTLKEVHVDRAWAITGYTLCSLVKCCPKLEVFSMCGNQSGMDGGLEYIFSRLAYLRILYVQDYPGDAKLGRQIGQLCTLKELYLAGSTMVSDEAVEAIAYGCPNLEVLEMSVPAGHAESTRHGVLTDAGLKSLGKYVPKLRKLAVGRRTFITDDGLCQIMTNGHLDTLEVGGSVGISDCCMEVLGETCGHCIRELHLSQLDNVTTVGIWNLCQKWFEKETKHMAKVSYALDVYIDDVPLEFDVFLMAFRLVSDHNINEFTMDGLVPRKVVRFHCDMLVTMYV